VTFTQWLLSNVGHAVDVDGAYGPQCVDAVNSYLSGVCNLPRVTGDAKDIAAQTIHGFSWTNNSATNSPRPGSILVWRPGRHGSVYVDPLGHTAVALLADRWGIISADQNWQDVRKLLLTLHNYEGLWGWHHPN
jgi:CHAP domain-containing protein